MNSFAAMLGSLAGGASVLALWGPAARVMPIGVAGGIFVGLVVFGYALAAVPAASGLGELMRGFLVGLNATLNAVLGREVFRLVLGPETVLFLGLGVCAVPFLSVFTPISRSRRYQGLLARLNWLMPMSWLVLGLGCLFFALNLIGHTVVFWTSRSEFWRVAAIKRDAKTGTFFVRGGWISNLNRFDTAFSMGNLAYVDVGSRRWYLEHEAGHTLNLAAFGSLFHLIGAIDESIIGRGANAYAERLAESNNPDTTQFNILPMWS